MSKAFITVTGLLLSFASASFAGGCIGDTDIVTMPPDQSTGGPDGGAPVEDGEDLTEEPEAVEPLAQWSACMTIEDWNASNMGAWADKPAEGGTVCSSCHGDGLARFNTDAESAMMYEYNRYQIFISGFFTVTSDGGRLVVVPATSKLQNKGNGSGIHPTYITGTSDPYFQSLETFYQLTLQRLQADNCNTAQFPG